MQGTMQLKAAGPNLPNTFIADQKGPHGICCGALSLLAGVELICLVDLIGKVASLGVVSSVQALPLAGIRIEPWAQLLFGAWQLLGIPLLIAASVGALYRVETHLRLYHLYWKLSVVFYALAALGVIFFG